MRDGLAFAEDYVDGEVSDTIQMLFGDGQADMAHFAADRPLAAPPGTRFNYSSGTSNIISGIVARTVGPGESYARFLHSRLFGPLGMSSADPEFDEAGTWVASSSLYATARDFAALRAALPARRPVGRRAAAARGMGRLRPHLGLGGPRGRQPLRRPLVGRGRRHRSAPSAPRATKASRSRCAPPSTSWWCAWARRRMSARSNLVPWRRRWCRPSPAPVERRQRLRRSSAWRRTRGSAGPSSPGTRRRAGRPRRRAPTRSPSRRR